MKPFAAENIPNTHLNDDAQVDGGGWREVYQNK